jgi:hypothetical protein
MRRLAISLTLAALAILAVVATVAAAGPAQGRAADQVRARTTVTNVLGLTQAQVRDLRQDGLTLAQIAERQKVDAQNLIDALGAQWVSRIEARVHNGALTPTEATALKEQVAVKAKAMVNQTATGGMRGAAVGAGPGNGAGLGANGSGAGTGRGNGSGTGTCDGTGPHGPTAP